MFFIIFLVLFIFLIVLFKDKILQLFKNKKFIIALIVIATITVFGYTAIKIYDNYSHSASAEEKAIIERYIYDTYGVSLKVKKSFVVYKGIDGCNPGIKWIKNTILYSIKYFR